MTAQNPANLKHKGTRDFLFALREKNKICGIEIQTRTAEQVVADVIKNAGLIVVENGGDG